MDIELARMAMTEPPGSALEKRNCRSEEERCGRVSAVKRNFRKLKLQMV